jgi:hypothetical protein
VQLLVSELVALVDDVSLSKMMMLAGHHHDGVLVVVVERGRGEETVMIASPQRNAVIIGRRHSGETLFCAL